MRAQQPQARRCATALETLRVAAQRLRDLRRRRQRHRADRQTKACSLVDSGLAASAAAVIAEIRKLSTRPIRFIINTHVHPDHVGGNVACVGRRSSPDFAQPPPTLDPLQPLNIIAHENVLGRMTAAGPGAKPETARRSNGSGPAARRVLHADEGHAFQRRSDRALSRAERAHRRRQRRPLPRIGRRQRRRHLHARRLPVHRLANGGSVQGEIAALNHILQLDRARRTRRKAARTSIPGHGRICDEADVVEFRDMVVIVRDRVQDLINKRMTLDQIKAARPTRDYDPRVRHAGELRQGRSSSSNRSTRACRRDDAGIRRHGAVPSSSSCSPPACRASSRRRAAARSPPRSPKDAAPIDLTGYWVSLVTEDWRWRMVTPLKGDSASVPINQAAKKIVNDVGSGEGRSGRQPVQELRRAGDHARAGPAAHHLAGRQHAEDRNRRGHADAAPAFRRQAAGQRSRRAGRAIRSRDWENRPPIPSAGSPLGLGPAAGLRSRSLEVATTNLKPGYLRKNGVPYSGKTTVTEYFERFAEPDGDDHLMVMTIVTDPEYLAVPFVITSDFKKEADGSKWDPTPCSAR